MWVREQHKNAEKAVKEHEDAERREKNLEEAKKIIITIDDSLPEPVQVLLLFFNLIIFLSVMNLNFLKNQVYIYLLLNLFIYYRLKLENVSLTVERE